MNELSGDQLNEWLAFERIDPSGEWREDWRFSVMISSLWNIAIKQGGGTDDELTNPSDFMRMFDPDRRDEEDPDLIKFWTGKGYVYRRRQSPEEIGRALGVGIELAEMSKGRREYLEKTKHRPPIKKMKNSDLL